MESASSVSLLIKLSVACCEEARGALTIPKCSRHASQALTPELQVATEDWRLKKCFTGITGRVPRLKLRSRTGSRREYLQSDANSPFHQENVRTILEVAVAMRFCTGLR